MDNSRAEPNDAVVSFDSEALILVDEQDREIGSLNKADAHRGSGVLHRAFSLFVFNDAGELLLQQRAAGKRLWGGFWSNTCCSHPRRGETLEWAIHRRLREELGFDTALRFLFKFQYQAQFDADGAEHELCSVYAGRGEGPVRVNPNEIAAVRWIAADALDREMNADPSRFTPWFRIEWQRIRAEFADWPAAAAADRGVRRA